MAGGKAIDRNEREARHVFVQGDSKFQARLRMRQALWREQQLLPVGWHRGRPLGSRIAMPEAEETLANFLTPAIGCLVRQEVDTAAKSGKLISQPRIFEDLLSSQPLSFNLFGELSLDPDLATAVCREMWPGLVEAVTGIDFEWSPGRGDERYLKNRSAFDVVIFHTTPTDEPAFIGVEVKYHENLQVGTARHRSRYDNVAAASSVFVDDSDESLRRPPEVTPV